MEGKFNFTVKETPEEVRVSKHAELYEAIVETFNSIKEGQEFTISKDVASPVTLHQNLSDYLPKGEYKLRKIVEQIDGKDQFTGLRILKVTPKPSEETSEPQSEVQADRAGE